MDSLAHLVNARGDAMIARSGRSASRTIALGGAFQLRMSGLEGRLDCGDGRFILAAVVPALGLRVDAVVH